MNPDIIFIRELKIETIIGILPWEQHIKQFVILDLEMACNIRKAAVSTQLQDTLDYNAVTQGVTHYLATRSFKLIETAAEEVAQFVMQQFNVTWLRLRLAKPGAVAKAQTVGVIIERTLEQC